MGDRMAVMKAGFLQQFGSPAECYDHPNNIFVAQFVGSPPMNLVEAQFTKNADGTGALQVGPSSLVVPASVIAARPSLSAYSGRPVAIGVRSEDMDDASLKPDVPRDRHLQGKVTLVEALGSEIVVHFDLQGSKVETEDTKLLAKEAGEEELSVGEGLVKWVASFAPRSRVRMGDTIEIAVDVDRVHWFDPTTGEAIR